MNLDSFWYFGISWLDVKVKMSELDSNVKMSDLCGRSPNLHSNFNSLGSVVEQVAYQLSHA